MTTTPDNQASTAPAETTTTSSTTAPAEDLAAFLAELKAVKTEFAELKALVAKPTPAPAPVPTTDTAKPAITPTVPDHSTLPPIARMAAGYGSK